MNPQRIFSLSLEDPAGWRAQSEDRELIPASGFEKGDLSLARSRGREEDAGDYVCRLEFNNNRSLERTVHVQVLQSELRRALTSADSVPALNCVGIVLLRSPFAAGTTAHCHSQEVVVTRLFSVSQVLLRRAACLFSSVGRQSFIWPGPGPVLTCV